MAAGWKIFALFACAQSFILWQVCPDQAILYENQGINCGRPGIDRRTLCIGGQFHDEERMARYLDAAWHRSYGS